jgi:hypothetical protein
MTYWMPKCGNDASVLLRNKAIISIFMNRATGRARHHNSTVAVQQEEENLRVAQAANSDQGAAQKTQRAAQAQIGE